MTPDDVDVVWIDVAGIPGDAWPALERRLDDAERARAARFHFDRDRHAYIAGHALVRTLLSQRHPAFAPEDWRFVATGHGRPEIAPDQEAPPLRFNLSHTHGMAAVAVTLETPVGIDVESLRRANLTMDLATRFFAPTETAHLAGLPPDALGEALYATWTLKEAYIKAVGRGLSLPLDSFAFTLNPPAIAFLDPATADDPAAWQFRRLRPGPDHALALALRHERPACLRVHARPAAPDDLAG